MLLYASGLLIGQRLLADLGALGTSTDVVVLPPPCPLTVQPIDFSHADALITRARHDARRHLRKLEQQPSRPTARASRARIT